MTGCQAVSVGCGYRVLGAAIAVAIRTRPLSFAPRWPGQRRCRALDGRVAARLIETESRCWPTSFAACSTIWI